MALLNILKEILKKPKQYKEPGKDFDTVAPFISDMSGGQLYLFALECFNYSFKDGELSLPLMVCVDSKKNLTRYATERENWLLWEQIKEYSPKLCKKVKSVKVGQCLFCIPNNAFNNADGKFNIESIDMSKSQVVYIGENAFAGIKSLGKVKLSKYTTVIDKNAFTNTSIHSLHIDKPEELKAGCKYLANKSVKRFGTIKPVEGAVYLNFPIDNSAGRKLQIVAHTENIQSSNFDSNECVVRFDELPKTDTKFIRNLIARGKYVLSDSCKLMLHYSGDTSTALACDAKLNEYILDQTEGKDSVTIRRQRNGEPIIETCRCYVDDEMVALAMKLASRFDKKLSLKQRETQGISYMARKIDTVLQDQKNPYEGKYGYTVVWEANHDVPSEAFEGLTAIYGFELNTNVAIGARAFASSPLTKYKGSPSSMGELAFVATNVKEISVNSDCRHVGYQGQTRVRYTQLIGQQLDYSDIAITPPDVMGDDE